MGHSTAERRTMAYSAGIMYGGATVLGIAESLLPGGEHLSLVPLAASILVLLFLVVVGPRLPSAGLFLFGALGAALIALAVGTTRAYGDGAVLYMWPAVWTAYFFGNRGTAFIVAWTGVVHGIALITLPDVMASVDRWLDVVVAVLVVAMVVRLLSSQRERLVARLASEARIDPLTGLLNRRGFDERLDTEGARAARDGTWLGLVTFDLDHFKRVNDEHGHEMGDRVLRWVGMLITEQIRGVDVAARVGGEEFVVLLPRADAAGALEFAERVRELVAVEGAASGRGRSGVSDDLPLSLSGGTAACLAPLDARTLLEVADRALYTAKLMGRNRIVADDAACDHLPRAALTRPR